MEKERIIKDRLQRLIEGIKKANYKDCDKEHMARLAEERINELQKRGVYCIDRFVQKLLYRIGDEEEYLDILMEGRFAIILARNNFSDIEIEYCDEGPDLKSRWNRNTVYFEVTRKRSIEDEWAGQLEDHKLPSNKIGNIIGKVNSKLKQLKLGEINIVVFWSSTVAVYKHRIGEAFEHIKNDPEKYKDLSGILFFAEGGFSIPTMKQCCLFKNEKALKPIGPRLTKKLDSLNELSPKQLKRERERWTAILKEKRN